MLDRSIHHSQRVARRDWFQTGSAHRSAGARVHHRARESCEYQGQIFQGSRVEEISVRIPQALLESLPGLCCHHRQRARPTAATDRVFYDG